MSSKKIRLKSSDGRMLIVDEKVAMMSQLIKGMIEDDCTENGIPLPKVTGETLEKVLKYCEKHAEELPNNDKDKANKLSELKAWDAKFMDVDQSVLFDILMAAHYLNIEGLLELTVQTVADIIEGKSVEEIRQTFDIKNDFTPQEKEENYEDYRWAFEENYEDY